MASNIFPSNVSPIKLIQRGLASSAGSITITAIDTTKSFIRSYSTGSAGTIGATGTESGTLSPTGS